MRKQIILNLVVAFLTLAAFFIALNAPSERDPLVNATIAAMSVILILTWYSAYEMIDFTTTLPVAAGVALAASVTIAENWLGAGFLLVLALGLLLGSYLSGISFAKKEKLNQNVVLLIMVIQFTITSSSMQLAIRNHLLDISTKC